MNHYFTNAENAHCPKCGCKELQFMHGATNTKYGNALYFCECTYCYYLFSVILTTKKEASPEREIEIDPC